MLSRLLKSRSLGARHGLLSKRLFTAHTVVPPPTVPIPKSAFVLDNEPAPLIKAHHDYKAIRQNAETIKENMKNRNYTSVDVDEVVKLIEERNSMIIPIQELRTRRKVVSDAVFTIMSKKKGNAAAELRTFLHTFLPSLVLCQSKHVHDAERYTMQNGYPLSTLHEYTVPLFRLVDSFYSFYSFPPFTHSLTYSLTHSLTHSLPPSLLTPSLLTVYPSQSPPPPQPSTSLAWMRRPLWRKARALRTRSRV